MQSFRSMNSKIFRTNWNCNTLVEVDPTYFRPTEVDLLIGDVSKAKKLLDWEPQYNVDQLIEEMVKEDQEILNNS